MHTNYKKIFAFFLIYLITPIATAHQNHSDVLKAHLPSGWYPQDAKKLTNRLAQLDKDADMLYDPSLQNRPSIIIVPHAGYSYSGTVAAAAFRSIQNHTYDKIIVLAPSHFIPFQGIAVPLHKRSLELSIGTLPLDTKSFKKLLKNKLFFDASTLFNDPFEQEHSFEIECPFIFHYTNKKTPIIPLLIGYLHDNELQQCALTLKKIITPKTLIIVSTDLIHYGADYDFMPFGPTKQAASAINNLDYAILQSIIDGSATEFLSIIKKTNATVCGKYPLALLLTLIEQKTFSTPLYPHLIAYTTSQEQVPSSDSSVSYGALAYTPRIEPSCFEQLMISSYAHKILLQLFISNDIPSPELILPFMNRHCGTFVTLQTRQGELRGCIGTIESDHTFLENLPIYIRQAALHDTRFAPVTKDEAPLLNIDTTMLSPFTPVSSYKDIIIGKHGILLQHGNHQAVFLPSVPFEKEWDLQTTLEQLSLKAGLPKNAWKDKKTQFKVCYEI